MKRFPLSEWLFELLEQATLSIRVRVILSYLVIIGIGFVLLTWQISGDVRPRYLEAEEETMVDIAHVLAAVAEQSFSNDRLDPTFLRSAFHSAHAHRFSAQIYNLTKTSINLRVYVTDDKGIVLFDSDHGKVEGQNYALRNDVFKTLRGQYGARSSRMQRRDPSTSVQFVAAPVMHNGKIVGVVSVSKPQTSIQEFMEHTQERINFLGTVAALSVVAIGTIFSAWITYPIRNLTKYAKAIRDGRRVKRPNLGHSEIRTLGMAFEEMRDALEGKDYVHRYVQTLTHEIKSPVAAIQGAAELLEEDMPPEQRRRFLNNIQAETARIKESVDSMLLLSSVESKKSLDCVVDLDLCEVVLTAASRMTARADLKSVRLVHHLPASACLRGDPLLLERTFSNLVENAVAFSPAGGVVSVAVTREGNEWMISVEDSGPGIPEFALGRVCDRFYSLPRPDTGKKSSGLGLAFVREVAVLHGGSISLRNRAEGGAQALLRLPG